MKYSYRRWSACIGIITCCLFAVSFAIFAQSNASDQKPSPKSRTVRISPPRVVLNQAAGVTSTGIIKLTNHSDVPMRTQVQLGDWAIISNKKTNRITFLPPGSTPGSCANWLQIIPPEAIIQPSEVKEFTYTMRSPEDAQGGYYAVAFFVSEFLTGQNAGDPAKAKDTQVGISTKATLPTVFYNEIQGTARPQIQVLSCGIESPNDNQAMTLFYEVKNVGNVYIRTEGYFHITDSTGKIYGTGKLEKTITQPTDTVYATVQWPGTLQKGEYDVVFTFSLEPISKELFVQTHHFAVRASCQIQEVALAQDTRKKQLQLVLHNNGNITYTPQGSITFTRKGAKETIEPRTFSAQTLGPEETTRLLVDISHLRKGDYHLSIKVTFDNETITKEQELSI